MIKKIFVLIILAVFVMFMGFCEPTTQEPEKVLIDIHIVDDQGNEQASWGSVDPDSGEYTSGETVDFTATPESGYLFVAWQDSSEQELGTGPTLSYEVPENDTNLYAVFEQETLPAPPSFTLTNHDNTQVSLSDLDGNYIMLTFSAGWCPHCHTQADYMDTVYSDLDTTHSVTNFINVVILIQGNGSSPATLGDIQTFHSSYPFLDYVLMDNSYGTYNAYDTYINDPNFGGLPSNVILRPLTGGGFEYVDFWAGAYTTASGLISALQTMIPDMFNQ